MLANYVAVQYSNERMEVDGKGYFTGRATTTRAGLSNLFCLFLFIFFSDFSFHFSFYFGDIDNRRQVIVE